MVVVVGSRKQIIQFAGIFAILCVNFFTGRVSAVVTTSPQRHYAQACKAMQYSYTGYPNMDAYGNDISYYYGNVTICQRQCTEDCACRGFRMINDQECFTKSNTDRSTWTDVGGGFLYIKNPINYAMGRRTYQSSTSNLSGFTYPASLAVDGEPSGDFLDRSCTLTNINGETDPWWMVDLGKPSQIEKVELWNRDEYIDALAGVQVWVGTSNQRWDAGGNKECDSSNYYDGSWDGRPFTKTCLTSGRYVWVRLSGQYKVLSLCEVRVYGYDTQACRDMQYSYTGYPNMDASGNDIAYYYGNFSFCQKKCTEDCACTGLRMINDQECFTKSNTDRSTWTDVGGGFLYIKNPSYSTFTFTRFDEPLLLNFFGSSQLKSSRIQLTPATSDQGGQALYKSSVPLLRDSDINGCQAASFSLQFSFSIYNDNKACHADGFAFNILGSNIDFSKLGGTGEKFGLQYTGLPVVGSASIVFDTYVNYYDPPGRYVGIREKFVFEPVTYNLTNILDDFNSSTKYAWADYDSTRQILQVYLSNKNSKPATPLLTYSKSLCELLRPSACVACQTVTRAYVGFSAGTGLCVDTHEIRSWKFDSSFPVNFPPPPRNPPSPPRRPPPSPPIRLTPSPPRPPPPPPPAPSDNTTFTFTQFDDPKKIILYGSSRLLSSQLQVTFDYWQGGRALFKDSVPLLRKNRTNGCEAASFNMQFSFRIYHDNKTCHGDGFAFTFLGSNIDFSKLGGYGDSMALAYTSQPVVGSVSIVFDTYGNEYDPSGRYVGIRENFVAAPVTYNRTTILDDFSPSTKYAWVDYDGARQILQVYLNTENARPATPLLTYKKSLCELLRPSACAACQTVTRAYVGFGAGTGLCVDTHEIQSWSFESSFTVYALGLDDAQPSTNSAGFSPYFFHASVGYFWGFNRPIWTLYTSWDWSPILSPVKDQGACRSCWVYATIGAIESVYYIANGLQLTKPPIFSEQQVARCLNRGCDDSGWPSMALSFAATRNLTTSFDLSKPCNTQIPTSTVRITRWERVRQFGWFGLLQAVLQQPVIVFVEASGSAFVNYRQGLFNDSMCFSSGVDHAVLLVGYVLDLRELSQSYWIVRNSWGASWGEQGYMRMQIIGGSGVCGINTLPGLIPVVKASGRCAFLNRTAVQGADLKILNKTISASQCCAECKFQPGCVTFTFNTATGLCRLKASRGVNVPDNRSISGMPVSENDPCNLVNIDTFRGGNNQFPGRMNPCGGGSCTPVGKTYTCQCPANFTVVTNSDKTQACAPVSPCTFTDKNPCDTGECVDSNNPPGSYTCICPLGYVMDASEGPVTCAFAATLSGPLNYTIPDGFNFSCAEISRAHGLNLTDFQKQNPKLSCASRLVAKTVLNVTNARPCGLSYRVNNTDTCASISRLFGLSSISGKNSPNPDLNCNTLQPRQQVCAFRSRVNPPGPCTNWYSMKSGETCSSVIKDKLRGNGTLFYLLNPGIYCDAFFSEGASVLGPRQRDVCIVADAIGSGSQLCKGEKPFRTTRKLTKTDNCVKLRNAYFKKYSFKALNNYTCTNKKLAEVLKLSKEPTICVPK